MTYNQVAMKSIFVFSIFLFSVFCQLYSASPTPDFTKKDAISLKNSPIPADLVDQMVEKIKENSSQFHNFHHVLVKEMVGYDREMYYNLTLNITEILAGLDRLVRDGEPKVIQVDDEVVRVTTNITIPRGIQMAGNLIWHTSRQKFKWTTGARITWNTNQDLRILLTDLQIQIRNKGMRVAKIDGYFTSDNFNWKLGCEFFPEFHHCDILKKKWNIFGKDLQLSLSQKLREIIEG